VALASKGSRLVTAGGDGVARIWKIGAKEKPIALEGHRGEVLYAAFSPNDQIVATSGKDGTVRVWNAESGACIFSIDAHAGAANSVNFSPDGEFLLTAGADDLIKLWRAEQGEFVREVDHCYDYVSDAVFSPDGKLMASCGGEGTVKLWEVTDQERISTQSMTDPGLEFEVERVHSDHGNRSSQYASGKPLFNTRLSGGARISVLQGGGGKHSICVGDPPRGVALVTGDQLTVLGGDGGSLLTYDLGIQSVAFDSTGGAARPFSEEGATAGAPVAAAPKANGDHSGFTGKLDVERATDSSQARYKSFERHGELLFTAHTVTNRAMRLVKFDDNTIYCLFGECDQPTLVIKSDYLDVRDVSGRSVFRFSLESLSPIISRRALDEQAASNNGKHDEGRDPLLVTSSADWMDQSGVPRLHKILSKAVWARASDIHIPSGAPILLRQHGRLVRFDDRGYKPDEIKSMLVEILTEPQRRRFSETNDLDFSYEIPGTGRFRANVCRQHRGVDGTFRIIPDAIPNVEDLGLPAAVPPLIKNHQGLILVTGSAGQGKSTTIAALVNMINSERPLHIITVEDPIEFVHPVKRAVVNQREVGKHTLSFANALRAALREDPDVIVVGEMRDLETISLAITAAETGHLVLGTLMTTDAPQTVDRILDSFPPGQQSQIRTMLSESLKGIVSQQLVPNMEGTGRALASEVLLCNVAVANMIRERKTFQLTSVMQTGRNVGMQRMDDSLFDLAQAGQISAESALMYAHDHKAMELRLKPKSAPETAVRAR
jgi:twitching motility protein PilT